jgi:hypothetical protein
VKAQTESQIIAALLQTETDSKCRLYQNFDEKTDHIISASPILAKEKYISMSVCSTAL